MKRTRFTTLDTWGELQPDRRIDFNGFFWRRAAGNVLIDPMTPTDLCRSVVAESGGARWILLTNHDHWRSTSEWRELTGAEIVAPRGDRERFQDHAAQVAHWFGSDQPLPGNLAEDVVPTIIRGGKSEVEAAFLLGPLNVLLFGDVVRSHACGELRLLPEEKLSDPDLVRETLPRDFAAPLEAILLGDGDSLFRGAEITYRDFLAALDLASDVED
ncbi:MAG: hypothetical protein RL885_18555 [Planctomycetota bacterium]